MFCHHQCLVSKSNNTTIVFIFHNFIIKNVNVFFQVCVLWISLSLFPFLFSSYLLKGRSSKFWWCLIHTLFYCLCFLYSTLRNFCLTQGQNIFPENDISQHHGSIIHPSFLPPLLITKNWHPTTNKGTPESCGIRQHMLRDWEGISPTCALGNRQTNFSRAQN